MTLPLPKPPLTLRRTLVVGGLLGLCAALTWQCKPPKGASLKSLDDAATGNTGIDLANLCGVDGAAIPDYVKAIGDSHALASIDQPSKDAVLKTLAVVPKSLVQLFFLAGAGEIIIGGADSACVGTPFTNEEKAIFGATQKVPACWIAPDSTHPLRLVLNADPKLIQFSLLRLLAYVQAEYFLPRLNGPQIQAPFNTPAWKAYAEGFMANRDRLAAAFLSDLTQAKASTVAAMTAHKQKDPVSFGNMVYANAVDSYYCSKHTNQTFQQSFGQTWNVFTDAKDAFAPLNHLGPAGN